PGLLTATTPVTFHSGNVALKGAAFVPRISGTPGGPADRLAVTGTVDLTGATLTPTRVGTPVTGGQTFVLISNDGTDPVVGTFIGLPEGTPVTVNGQPFRLSYTGGDGNDVVLSTPSGGSRTLTVSGQPNGSVQVFTPSAAGQYATTPT